MLRDASFRWHDKTNATAVFRMNLVWVWVLALLIAAPLQADPLLPTKIELFSNRALPVKEDFVSAQPIEVVYYKLVLFPFPWFLRLSDIRAK